MADIRLGWWLSSEEHDPRDLVQHAVGAEQIGVTTAMISDHLQPWSRAQGQASYVWTVIGAIAARTEQLEVGTGVTAMVGRASPITVAQAAATATVMLDGRFFLGVGTGERLNEQPFGGRWPRAAERRDALAESVDLVRRLFAGEMVDHRGDRFVVEHLRLMTRPASPPQILVAASGKRSARLAGEVGDGLIGVEPNGNLVEAFRGAGGAGRAVAQLHASLARTEDEARDQAFERWPNGVVPPAVLGELATPPEFEAIAEAIGPGPIGDTVVCASDAAPVIAAIDRFAGAGFDTVYVHQVGPDQARLRDVMARELLPHYGARSS
jgi:coenzyme F420-dependent glucose-6-phosphate dehydrogenase